MKILTNHLGYGTACTKKAIVQIADVTQAEPSTFQLIQTPGNTLVHEGVPVKEGAVANWRDWSFWIVDFTGVTTGGKYKLRIFDATGACEDSHPFSIADGLIKETISDVLYYFKTQRCSDVWDEKDKSVTVYREERAVDVHGGWYDASGDVSKYLSHLSYANFMNPQQTPMIVWNMLRARAELRTHFEKGKRDQFTNNLSDRLETEAMYGADFLVRMQDPSGAFYMTVFDQWTHDPKQRMICEYVGQEGRRLDTWQAAFRQGGGMAIAALAAAAQMKTDREFSSEEYLEAAQTGFAHLQKNNIKYCNDGKENIIDDYCALMAANELCKATGDMQYMEAATVQARNLLARVSSDTNYQGWLRADDGTRTFTHGAEAGLPVIALLEFKKTTHDSALKQQIVDAVKMMMEFEITITSEVINPFGYPRQYVTEMDGSKRSSFFIAQNNPSGYWWQGENARIASLVSAAMLAARELDSALASELKDYATNLVNWILGLNPYDCCMLHGQGFNNANYIESCPSAPGGICNGITAGFSDKDSIDFNPEYPAEATADEHRWRWGEQWIPHSGWYILAIAAFDDNA